jgi:hypothetical protein
METLRLYALKNALQKKLSGEKIPYSPKCETETARQRCSRGPMVGFMKVPVYGASVIGTPRAILEATGLKEVIIGRRPR